MKDDEINNLLGKIKELNEELIKCRFCNEKAMYETQTNNVYICEKNRCHLDYVSETIKPIKK
jgi:hypothetical protein